jgi:hypothetical protein
VFYMQVLHLEKSILIDWTANAVTTHLLNPGSELVGHLRCLVFPPASKALFAIQVDQVEVGEESLASQHLLVWSYSKTAENEAVFENRMLRTIYLDEEE